MSEENFQEESGPVVKEYKGHPILVLNPDSRFPFSFGLGKAKLIIEHLETIKEFIANQEGQ